MKERKREREDENRAWTNKKDKKEEHNYTKGQRKKALQMKT